MAVSQSIFLAVAKNPDDSELQLRNLEEPKFPGYDADLKTLRWVIHCMIITDLHHWV